MPVIEDRSSVRETAPNPLSELSELEALWDHAPALPARAPTRPRRSDWLWARLGPLLFCGWVAFLASALALEPAPEPGAAIPAWAALLGGGFFLALLSAPLIGLAGRSRLGFGVAALGGVLGMATAVACSATEHHAGSFWIYELAGAGILTAASLAGSLRSSSTNMR